MGVSAIGGSERMERGKWSRGGGYSARKKGKRNVQKAKRKEENRREKQRGMIVGVGKVSWKCQGREDGEKRRYLNSNFQNKTKKK